VKAKEAVGWLVDFAGPMEDALATVWKIVTHGDHGLRRRELEAGVLDGVSRHLPSLPEAGNPGVDAARAAIVASVEKPAAHAWSMPSRSKPGTRPIS